MQKTLFIILFVLASPIASAQNQFQNVFKDSTRPHKENIRLEFQDFIGNQTFMPISVLKGKTEGPVFTIVAGVHGFEYPPIVATQELLKEINIDSLSGTLIVVPIANTGSFYTRTPFINPQDKLNLNGAFPGKSDGTVTQKIAHFIKTNVIPLSDVFLDIHGGDASEDLLPFVCYYNNENFPEQTRMAKRLSEISGFEYVVSYPYTLKPDDPAKYTFKQACQDGKIALSIESGKLGNVQEKEVTLIKNGVYSMLKEMKMYGKNIENPPKKIINLNDQKYIDSNRKGIFYSTYKAGDSVNKGDKVGYITDEFGNVISEFTAPVTGIILYKIATPPVNIDETIMCISRYDG